MPSLAQGKDTQMKYRLLLVGALFLLGCQNIVGPFQQRKPERVDDPLLTINEQQRRARDRLALPDDSPNAVPSTGTLPPGVPLQGGH